MCNPAIAYAAAAVASVGSAAYSASQARKAPKPMAPPPPPAPTAEAPVNPEAANDPRGLAVMSRNKLRIDLNAPAPGSPNVGSGLMVPTNG